MLMAAINRSDDERDNYLYAREEYGEISDSENETVGEASEALSEEAVQVEDTEEHGGYEIPDFLRGLDDTDIVKIS